MNVVLFFLYLVYQFLPKKKKKENYKGWGVSESCNKAVTWQEKFQKPESYTHFVEGCQNVVKKTCIFNIFLNKKKRVLGKVAFHV